MSEYRFSFGIIDLKSVKLTSFLLLSENVKVEHLESSGPSSTLCSTPLPYPRHSGRTSNFSFPFYTFRLAYVHGWCVQIAVRQIITHLSLIQKMSRRVPDSDSILWMNYFYSHAIEILIESVEMLFIWPSSSSTVYKYECIASVHFSVELEQSCTTTKMNTFNTSVCAVFLFLIFLLFYWWHLSDFVIV